MASDNQNDISELHDWYTGSRQLSNKCDADRWLSGQTDLDDNPLFLNKAYCRCEDWS